MFVRPNSSTTECDKRRQLTAYLINHTALALKDDQKEKENKRHTMSHPPDHIPELDSPRQSRSPIKKDKKERVSLGAVTLALLTPFPVFW